MHLVLKTKSQRRPVAKSRNVANTSVRIKRQLRNEQNANEKSRMIEPDSSLHSQNCSPYAVSSRFWLLPAELTKPMGLAGFVPHAIQIRLCLINAIPSIGENYCLSAYVCVCVCVFVSHFVAAFARSGGFFHRQSKSRSRSTSWQRGDLSLPCIDDDKHSSLICCPSRPINARVRFY